MVGDRPFTYLSDAKLIGSMQCNRLISPAEELDTGILQRGEGMQPIMADISGAY